MEKEIKVYIDVGQIKKVVKEKVCVGDVVSIQCSDEVVKNRVKAVKLFDFKKTKEMRVVITALKIVDNIYKEVQGIDISISGVSSMLIELDKGGKTPKFLNYLKVSIICLTLFFGSALTIMAFNNEAGIETVFSQYYKLISGEEKKEISILEISYSIGIGLGIIVFYNHFGGKKISNDPTPIEVEMRLYENDLNKTLIDGVKRKESHIDVE